MAKKDNVTAATEENSIYDSILSTCCCGTSSPDVNSIAQKGAYTKQQQQQLAQSPPPPPQQQQEQDGFGKQKLWDRLTNAALYLTGGAPPVTFVKCFECSSVDGSELSIPRALTDLAEEYDRKNRSLVNSIWSTSENVTERTPVNNTAVNESGTEHRRQEDRVGSGRPENKKMMKTSSSESSSYFSWRSRKNPKREKKAFINMVIRGKRSRRSKPRAAHPSLSNDLQCDEC